MIYVIRKSLKVDRSGVLEIKLFTELIVTNLGATPFTQGSVPCLYLTLSNLTVHNAVIWSGIQSLSSFTAFISHNTLAVVSFYLHIINQTFFLSFLSSLSNSHTYLYTSLCLKCKLHQHSFLLFHESVKHLP